MNIETDYMNGGVYANILRMAIKNGRRATPDELLTLEAHDAMPRNVFYTESQLEAKRVEIEARADELIPNWREDEYLDLYGIPTDAPRPKRMSAYDKANTRRTI